MFLRIFTHMVIERGRYFLSYRTEHAQENLRNWQDTHQPILDAPASRSVSRLSGYLQDMGGAMAEPGRCSTI